MTVVVVADGPLVGEPEERLASALADDAEVPFTSTAWSLPALPLPRFGDLEWDISGLNVQPRTRQVLRFWKLSPEWNLIARELIYLRTRGHRLLRTQVRARLTSRRAARASSLSSVLRACVKLERACAELGLGLPADWTAADVDRLSEWVRENYPHASVGTVVSQLHDYRDLLTLGGPRRNPLRGNAVYDWAGAKRPDVTLGYGVPPDVFVPLLQAALAYIERFADDIVAAHAWKTTLKTRWDAGDVEPLPKQLPADHPAREIGIRGPLLWRLHQLVEEHGALPAYTVDSGSADGRAGQLAFQTIAALIDNPNLKNNSTAKAWLRDQVAGGVPLRPGMLPLTVSDTELPDGSTGPWRQPWCWNAVKAEVTALRDAAAIVLVAFTGMRASEALAIPRTGWRTTWWGHPAIESHLIKTTDGESRRWWATPPVIRACELLEATCPPNAKTLLASSVEARTSVAARTPDEADDDERDEGSSSAQTGAVGGAAVSEAALSSHEDLSLADDVEQDPAVETGEDESMSPADVELSTTLRRFVVTINNSQTLTFEHHIPVAASWGVRSSDGDSHLNPHAFRHTLAAIGNTATLGDAALYSQFQHATHAVTWTYMRNSSTNKWTELLVNRHAVEGLEAALGMAAEAWAGEANLGGPAGRKLQATMLAAFEDAGVPPYDPESPDEPAHQLAAAVVDTPQLAALLRSVAGELHLGAVNHCRFDPLKALCTTDEASLPVLAACVPEQCGNVVTDGGQNEVFADLLAETEQHLQMKRLPDAQRQLLELRATNLRRVLGEGSDGP